MEATCEERRMAVEKYTVWEELRKKRMQKMVKEETGNMTV